MIRLILGSLALSEHLLYVLIVYSVDEANLGSLVSPFVTVIHVSLAGYRPGKIVIILLVVLVRLQVC